MNGTGTLFRWVHQGVAEVSQQKPHRGRQALSHVPNNGIEIREHERLLVQTPKRTYEELSPFEEVVIKNVNAERKNPNAGNLLSNFLFRADSPNLPYYGFPGSFPYREKFIEFHSVNAL